MLVLGDLGRNNASCRAARASLLSSGSSRARSGTFSARREAAAHLRLKLNSQCRSVSPTLALTELRIESSQRWEPNIHAIAKIAPSGASAPGTLLDATSSCFLSLSMSPAGLGTDSDAHGVRWTMPQRSAMTRRCLNSAQQELQQGCKLNQLFTSWRTDCPVLTTSSLYKIQTTNILIIFLCPCNLKALGWASCRTWAGPL